jgi:hypothetical protein
MDSTKYIGMDVHKEATTVAVMNAAGKLLMESILETKAVTIVQVLEGLRGELHVTFEEGTWAAWLYDLLKPYVTKVVVCDPRKNALLKAGNKSDRIDARKLAELLRAGLLSAVYHGETGLRTLKESSRSYLTISKDLTRTMNRLKALYRSWSIPCAGPSVYAPRHRAEWLSKITEAGVRRRAELFYQQLDGLQVLCHEPALPDSVYRSDSSCSVDRADPDAASVSHEETTMGVQRFGSGDAQQWGIPLCARSTATIQEARRAAWSQ